MRFSIAADERTGVAEMLEAALTERSHEVVARHGALSESERDDWAWAAEATGRADQALLDEILDAWLAAEPSPEDDDRANVAHLAEI